MQVNTKDRRKRNELDASHASISERLALVGDCL